MELQAPSHWRAIDFISDLHLQATELKTLQAWQHYLQSTTADAVFILGDLFEVWVGDDAIDAPSSFERLCTQTLRKASGRLALYILHGNRDFLMGQALMQAAGATLIADPTVLHFADQRYLLTHGDALCLEDTAYLAFREQVRSAAWQIAFLEKPLSERQALARQMRSQSELRKRSGVEYADVDAGAADRLLLDSGAETMIHGHTHKPNHHALGGTRSRWVLSDWDLDHPPARADVLRIAQGQPQPYRLDPVTLGPKTPG
ncbi:MAG: UDP-2,3-diacylglucosamine diphosphatase [Burkholderiales bacterium PBB3]|nr:MAG: UDP-2,3-diacylglucosamine diphosphatase [Burkholderiales bacterium PBB3]